MQQARLTAFVYAILQKMPQVEVEKCVQEAETVEIRRFTKEDKRKYADQRQAVTAKRFAERLLKRRASGALRDHLDEYRP
jgi:hypothetical protein